MKTGRTSIAFKIKDVFFIIKNDYFKRQNSACQNHTKTGKEELTLISECSLTPETSSLNHKYNLQ